MSNYIINTILFQLLFLGVYELSFKRETFFTVNRFYLLGSFVLSLVLPLIKIPIIAINSTPNFNRLFIENLDEVVLSVNALKQLKDPSEFTLIELILMGGILVSFILFIIKLFRIYQLKRQGKSIRSGNYTKVILPKTDMVFSFFNTVFIGEQAIERSGETILKHEMVHVNQKHTVDLLLFELLRIVFWFNPLVYIFQSKVSEVHEYISDRLMSSEEKKEKYQLLLQQLFNSQNISFVNSFNKKSLIKKRIIMLKKDYSNKRKMLKYTLVIPIIAAMLTYSSCSEDSNDDSAIKTEVAFLNNPIDYTNVIIVLDGKVIDESTMSKYSSEEFESVEITSEPALLDIYNSTNKEVAKLMIIKTKNYVNTTEVSKLPFNSVDKVPVFPGCENADNPRACFNSKVNEHIRKYFKYPEEALNNNIQGRVFVQFTVKADGVVDNIRLRGPHKSLEEATKIIIEKLPNMTPGENNGKKVEVTYSVPVSFLLK